MRNELNYVEDNYYIVMETELDKAQTHDWFLASGKKHERYSDAEAEMRGYLVFAGGTASSAVANRVYRINHVRYSEYVAATMEDISYDSQLRIIDQVAKSIAKNLDVELRPTHYKVAEGVAVDLGLIPPKEDGKN